MNFLTAFLVAQPALLSPVQDPEPEVVPTSEGTELDLWDRPDTRPPVSAWWSEVLEEGSWAVGYRFRHLSYDGLRDSRDDVSSSDVFGQGYDEAPEEMQVSTHTLEFIYGLREFTSVFLTMPFHTKDLSGDATAGELDQESSGLGDLILGVIHHCCSTDAGGKLLLHLGLGIPTGSIDEDGDAPGGGETKLPFPMQLGTGTFNLHPGLYWIQTAETYTWGAGARWRVHLERNDEGYAPGDSGTIQAWVSKEISNDTIGILRLQTQLWGDYHGSDDELDVFENPLNDDERQGGARTDIFAGLGIELGSEGSMSRLDIEVGIPIDEWLDGPQLSNEWSLGLGWRYSF